MKKASFCSVATLILLSVFSVSCKSYRELLYFQNLQVSTPSTETIENFSPITIQNGDVLSINVTSLNPEASATFNPNLANSVNPNDPLSGYQVDSKGMIEIPLLGNLKAAGLTTSELKEQIKTKITTYLKEPAINVRILNFKVSVMGDVGRPDVYTVHSERITLPEAITLAGDLNVTANRTNLWLIREQDGKRQYIPVDLTSKDLFQSPYYYLKNNDLVYIQPGKAKYTSVDNTYRNIGLLLSVLSIAAIIITNR